MLQGNREKAELLSQQVCLCDASQSLGQVCSSKEKLYFFSPPPSLFLSLLLSLSLSVLAAFPCVPGWTLLPWKRSRETVQDVAGAQTRRTLFVRWEKEVGMDEILFWLDADCHFRFELKRQKSHRASTKGWVRVGLQLLWAVCSQLKYIKGIILDLLMLASLYLICNFKGNRREKKHGWAETLLLCVL